MGLSCSTPVTIASNQEGYSGLNIQINEKEEAVVSWLLVDGSDVLLQAAMKIGDTWLDPHIVARERDLIYERDCFIDDTANLRATWIVKNKGKISLKVGEKSFGNPFWETRVVGNLSHNMVTTKRHCSDGKGKMAFVGGSGLDITEELADVLKNKKTTFHIRCSDAIEPILLPLIAVSPYQQLCMNSKGSVFGLWARPDISLWDLAWGGLKFKLVYEGAWQRGRESWSSPEKIPITDAVFPLEIQMGIDVKDNTAIIWRSYKMDEKGERKDTLKAITKYDGKWTDATPLCSPEEELVPQQPCSRISLIPDAEGNWLAMWESIQENKVVIRAAYKPIGKSWTEAKNVSPSHMHSRLGSVKSDHQGHFVAIWQEQVGSYSTSIFGATFSVNDQVWSSPVRLSSSDAHYGFPICDFNRQGKGMVAWLKVPNCGWDQEVQVATLSIN